MPEPLVAQTTGKKTFTILHTNDLHSNLIGMAPASDYTPLTLNDDNTRGGFARLATKIGERKAATEARDRFWCSMPAISAWVPLFAAATRETGPSCGYWRCWAAMRRLWGTMISLLGPTAPLQPLVLRSMQSKCRWSLLPIRISAPPRRHLQDFSNSVRKGAFATILSLNAVDPIWHFWCPGTRSGDLQRQRGPRHLYRSGRGGTRDGGDAARYRKSRCGDRAQPWRGA